MMFFPVFLPLIVGFLGLLAYKRHVHTSKQTTVNETFLSRETVANATRRKDISTLDYLPFSTTGLPIGSCADEELGACEEILTALASQRILNLSGITNTELKKLYGPANLNDLMQYDENFTLMEQTLLRYSLREEALGRTAEAAAVLEYAIEMKADLADIYLNLAALWKSQNRTEEIQNLSRQLSVSDDLSLQRTGERMKNYL